MNITKQIVQYYSIFTFLATIFKLKPQGKPKEIINYRTMKRFSVCRVFFFSVFSFKVIRIYIKEDNKLIELRYDGTYHGFYFIGFDVEFQIVVFNRYLLN